MPLIAKLLPFTEESDTQSELEAAVKPTRIAAVGAYAPNELPLT